MSGVLRSVLSGQRRKRYAKTFQVVEFSIQDNHVHMLVEATGHEDAADNLRSGVSGLVIAFAKRLNMLLGRRGKVWGDRWHGRDLATPREVRNALVYIFRNVVRHGARMYGEGIVDPRSSAWRFEGWNSPVVAFPAQPPWPHPRPRTWLLGKGWTIHGLLDPVEIRRA